MITYIKGQLRFEMILNEEAGIKKGLNNCKLLIN